MWRLFSMWFGWDYVIDTRDAKRKVRRIHTDRAGGPYYKVVGLGILRAAMRDPLDYAWLTCSPHKYFPPEKTT